MIIAPWLQAADPIRSGEAGARIGLEYRGQNIGADEHAASLGEQHSEFAQSQALDQEKIQGALAEAKAKTELATTLAARKFQAQQMYQQAVAGGADPVQAMLQFGPGMNQSMAGVGSIAAEQFRMHQASLPPQPILGPDGKIVGYQGQNIRMLPSQKATIPPYMVETETTPGTKEIPGIPGKPAVPPSHWYDWSTWGNGEGRAAIPATPDTPATPTIRRTRKIPLDEDGNEVDQGDSAPATPTNQDDPLGLFSK